jgi:hypothetical protein
VRRPRRPLDVFASFDARLGVARLVVPNRARARARRVPRPVRPVGRVCDAVCDAVCAIARVIAIARAISRRAPPREPSRYPTSRSRAIRVTLSDKPTTLFRVDGDTMRALCAARCALWRRRVCVYDARA